MADEQEIRVKFTADTSDLERGARKAEEAVRRTQQGGASKGADKAAKDQQRVAKATKQTSAEAASWKSILGSVNPQFGSLADKADEAFGRVTEGFRATGKGAGVAKAAGVAAIAAIAVEAIGIGMKIRKAIWDFAKSAFKAFDPVQYSKTFGALTHSFKRFKTALGGLLQGPVQVLVYTATGLLNALSKIVIKMYELQKRLGVMRKVVGWFKDVLHIDEDLNTELDGTVAAFDRLNILGQDEGDQATRDEMTDEEKEAEDAKKNADAYTQTAEQIKSTLEGTSLPVLNWTAFFGDAPTVSKQLAETILTSKYPDQDWSAFFGDSPEISTKLAETILSIAIPEGDWSGYFGDAPTVSKQLAATLLSIRIPEIDWGGFFGDSETVSTRLAATLLGLTVPSVSWSGVFGDAEAVSRNIAQTLLDISLPTVDWAALFSDAPTVSTNIAQTLLEIAVPSVNWTEFFGDSETVSTNLAATLMGILIPDQDWGAYFGDAPTVSKQLLQDILASKYPDQDWSGFFDDSGTVSKALLETILSSVYPDQDWSGFFDDSQTVATALLKTLLELAPPGTVDWSGFFKGGEDGTKDTQDDLDDLHAPTLSWEAAFAGFFAAIAQAASQLASLQAEAAKGITVTVKKVYEGAKSIVDNSLDTLTGKNKGSANVTKVIGGGGNTTLKEATDNIKNGADALGQALKDMIPGGNMVAAAGLDHLDFSGALDSSTLQSESFASSVYDSLLNSYGGDADAALAEFTDSEKRKKAEAYYESIGALAGGGLIAPNDPKPWILGDNPQEYEVVSPVSTIVDSVKRAITELNGSSGGGGIGGTGPIELTINLDGRRIARQIYDPLQTEARRRGAAI